MFVEIIEGEFVVVVDLREMRTLLNCRMWEKNVGPSLLFRAFSSERNKGSTTTIGGVVVEFEEVVEMIVEGSGVESFGVPM
jgi:hypothetical protein